jgi:hypothetical protein
MATKGRGRREKIAAKTVFVVDNLRLQDLILIASKNRAFYDEFLGFLRREGYKSVHQFVTERSDSQAEDTFRKYFEIPFSSSMLDGVGRSLEANKAKWYFIAWMFRDAPAQRLGPILETTEGKTLIDRKVRLSNKLRRFVTPLLPEPEHWDWPAIFEVVLARLEGSRRALKGGLIEGLVRKTLKEVFAENGLELQISEKEVRLHDESYDVAILGKKGKILIPVKTRETMGGGHALLFTRDIHKSISVAKENGFECVPIIIAESWGGDLEKLPCKQHIYIPLNPNQAVQLEPALRKKIQELLPLFWSLW